MTDARSQEVRPAPSRTFTGDGTIMTRGSISRWLRVAGATTLVIAFAPLTAGSASASIGTSEEDRRVTICHRTNSDTNPYVVISPSKMSIVKEKGHDSHEGPVYDPTLKGQKIMWGDIIPPFDYYASEKDRRAGGPVQSYPGSDNFTEGGAEIYANECQVPDEPDEPDEPDTDRRDLGPVRAGKW